MIEFSDDFKTYTCPYCGCKQSFDGRYEMLSAKESIQKFILGQIGCQDACIDLYVLRCINGDCQETTIIAYNHYTRKQYDIFPHVECKHFPNYIPSQIRNDYEEGCAVIQESPKAAATLFRRCLQGMIHDFWKIYEKNLNAEITQLKEKVSITQWEAIDGLRKIGNIGAHMESDVNLIIDIEPQEAQKLQKLIEVLLKQWYIDRHEEECLYAEIVQTAEDKEEQRNNER